jgi:hypothetical protein
MFSFFKIIILSLFILSACSTVKNNTNTVPDNSTDEPKKDSKQIEAVIVDLRRVDGCGFLLELPNREKLIPENLPSEFAKDKMKVMIKYHIIKKMSVCMVGKTVYLDFIKAQNE